MRTTQIIFAFATLVLAQSALAQGQGNGPPPPPGDVNVINTPGVTVTNFPGTQPVSGTVSVDNLPGTQTVSGTVSVNNLPPVQDVNIIESGKQQIEILQTLGPSDGPGVPARISNPANPLFPILDGQVPSGKKMVLTDILVNYSVTSSTGIASLNILRARSGSGCSGPRASRHQVRIADSSTHNTNLSTGIEFYENEYLCMNTGATGPDISITIFGYFEDM
jgi:hypothetical protein